MLNNVGTASVLAMSLLAAQGCVVHTYDTYEDPPPHEVVIVETNYTPLMLDAEAGVFWDNASRDDVWYFDAWVDDPNGVYDVVGVWADVYDECRGGQLVESFELYPTNDPYYWSSEWYGSQTWLDPFHDCYSVDFVAYDIYDDFDFITVWALTY